MIRLAFPAIDEREVQSVAAVLNTAQLVSGRLVERFEAELAERTGRKYGIAVSNGTTALALAMEALGVYGKQVIVPALTWPSPAHAAVLAGARPLLVDIDEKEWNIDPKDVAAAVTDETALIVAIDQFGVPARHEELAQAAAVRGTTPLFLEDAACALGSALGGRPCGSFGVVSIISFHPRKVITTGEGGMCLTDDGDLAERIRQSRNHGLDHKGRFVVARGNARMTEIQAAIGLAQLAKLEKIVARRREIAAHYRARLSDLPLSFQSAPDSAQRNEQSFGCVLHFGGESTRNRIIASARSMGVELGPLSHHLGVLPSLAPFGPHRPTPISANVAQRGFALPIHSRLSDEEVETVIRTVRRCIEEVVSDDN